MSEIGQQAKPLQALSLLTIKTINQIDTGLISTLYKRLFSQGFYLKPCRNTLHSNVDILM